MVSYTTSPVVHSRLFPSPEEASNTSTTWAQSRRNWKPFPGSFYVGDIGVPLLRTWDDNSGSIPNQITGDMLARDSTQRLHTDEVRRRTLGLHLNHSNWAVDTPYISFQASEQRLQELAEFRKTRTYRETQTITVIDPEVRLRAGWPVLCVGREMEYYGIAQDPYRNPPRVHDNHYVCLWRVEREEIVGHWLWDDLSRNPDWYNAVILPAFRQFRQERRQREQEEQRRLEQERQQALVESRVDDILGAIGALGLNDSIAGPSSENLSGQSIQEDEQSNDSGIGSDDELEGVKSWHGHDCLSQYCPFLQENQIYGD
ncbi:hypothetical protein CEP52_015110 [Fusarium oligoseptatum]|uniref:Uncharacterized protein n=1 Tax=Fusarium oligoseptatum TaxID=2604345 RepID=A0A428SG44_9HYPO|nr:hypothetical protein CEP52_015110 [Fusarium oligoseptatum]